MARIRVLRLGPGVSRNERSCRRRPQEASNSELAVLARRHSQRGNPALDDLPRVIYERVQHNRFLLADQCRADLQGPPVSGRELAPALETPRRAACPLKDL